MSSKLHRDDVVRYVRSLLETKYVHQGRLPGIGIDCIGVITCTARQLEIPHKDDTCYKTKPTGILIDRLETAGLVRCEDLEIIEGRILVFEFKKDNPQHVAVAVSPTRMVHTHAGVRKVVEHEINHKWLAKLHSVWEYPVEWQQ